MSKRTTSRSTECRDIHDKWRIKLNNKNGSPYKDPKVCRCRVCEVFMLWEGIFCPCCGYKVSRRPRSSDNMDKYREIKQYVYQ